MLNDLFNGILQKEFLSNTLGDYAVAVITFIVIFLGLWIIKRFILASLRKLSQKTANDFDDFTINLLIKVNGPIYLMVSLYLATRPLVLDIVVDKVITFALIIVLTFKAIKLIQDIIGYALKKFYLQGEADASAEVASENILLIFKWALWAAATLFVLDNLGINITAVVAGLGIGGVAVALAAQAILGDLFSSFAIFLDKPFKVGDFIIVGDYLGVVEHIGIKTTRIRSLGGEQIIFSNSDLTNSRVRNYKRMQKRRVVFKVGVTYQTTSAQIKIIPQMIKEIINGVDKTTFDRSHFINFGNFSLDIENVYYIDGNDYNLYMDIQQEINQKIKEKFKEKGIEFAYPTQTLFLAKEGK
ncbi:MAG: mechanosensitive ion channel family protein [Candidatus Margulisbacteria bacterium]|nr:mechanosensitive ion channel family protein [Candidatus Margulisiibacteriota bacterium]MBU1021841.1 mechanosensitive ion channel family protein [Candidatus Margulisiibacteriota bacterium]MBU1729000.1 mechanosensitive ion channel family protein [Candidatus Margulisiibacteriota bacterium]MBU1954447.1 mechanosensitive ion channel family protein [Candidatus Margulisiibacteriota bacterium]